MSSIYDERREKVIGQRWNDIVEIKEEEENYEDANRRIIVLSNAQSVNIYSFVF